jgi:hypothetical protein
MAADPTREDRLAQKAIGLQVEFRWEVPMDADFQDISA